MLDEPKASSQTWTEGYLKLTYFLAIFVFEGTVAILYTYAYIYFTYAYAILKPCLHSRVSHSLSQCSYAYLQECPKVSYFAVSSVFKGIS